MLVLKIKNIYDLPEGVYANRFLQVGLAKYGTDLFKEGEGKFTFSYANVFVVNRRDFK